MSDPPRRGRPSCSKTNKPEAKRTGPVPGSRNRRPSPVRASPFSAPYAKPRPPATSIPANSSARAPIVGEAAPVTGSSVAAVNEISGPAEASGEEAEAGAPRAAVVPAAPPSSSSPQGQPGSRRRTSVSAEESSGADARGPVREASGRFGPSVDFLRALTPQDYFAGTVRVEVDGRMKRKGRGSKHGVSGKLDRGSPWFYPPDPLVSAIPDLAIHLMLPIFLCSWEFLDPDIKAPSCPSCRSPDNVSSTGALSCCFYV